MPARSRLSLAVVSVWLSLQSQSFGQSRTDLVCWANADELTLCPQEYRTRVFPCGSGGHVGFHNDYVCQQICGADMGPRCRIIVGPGGPRGRCGYRAARVDCFN